MKRGIKSVVSGLKMLNVLCIIVGILIFIAPLSSAFAANSKITAMTRNLYLGADIFDVVEAAQTDPDSVPYVVAEVYQTMLYTNFWARAEAIADEIARNKPQVIGLQEVSTFYLQTPGDFIFGNPTQASTVVIDFYEVLDRALRARKMYYQAFSVTNADVELPMADLSAGPPYYLSDVRMVDHDYILVRKCHKATQVLGDNYQAYLEMDLGGVPVEFKRGFLGVDVKVDGEFYRFVNTHLEVSSSPDSVFRVVQSYQMEELLGTLAWMDFFYPKPLILVGDFNSSPDDVPGYGLHPVYGWLPYTPPYMQAVDAFYLDSWLLQKKYDEGYTSGFDDYVSDPNAKLDTRIDLIFLDPKDLSVEKVKCDVVGDAVRDMIPNPNDPGSYLWPSDHAGVVGDFKFK